VASPQTGAAPLVVTFTATAEDAEDAPAALTYAWDLNGDGLYENGTNLASLQHVYAVAGLYNASVRVTDSSNAWSAYGLTLLVAPPPPAPNQTPTAGFTVVSQQRILPLRVNFAFDGRVSTDPEGPLTYNWDFDGDGSWDIWDGPATVNHVYPLLGTYDARLRVKDEAGATADAYHKVFAPSCWCGIGGEPGSSSRCASYAVGPATANLGWFYRMPLAGFCSNLAVDADGLLLVCHGGVVYAMQDNGGSMPTTRWSYDLANQIYGGPVVGPGGLVFVTDSSGKMYAFAPNGSSVPSLKWSYSVPSAVTSSPAIGADGTVYAVASSKVLALADNGSATPTLKWSYESGSTIAGPCIVGHDGTIYFTAQNKKVYALADKEAAGALKWTYTAGSSFSVCPVVDAEGIVYVVGDDATVSALVDIGTGTPAVKWSYPVGQAAQSLPAIDAAGNIIVCTGDGKVLALHDNGTTVPTLVWSFDSGAGWLGIFATPVVDAAGTVFIGVNNDTLYALQPNGSPTPTVLWTYGLTSSPCAPCIGPDGTLYVVSHVNEALYSFKP
jgi:PKD repeat protein